jgi:hypothetical protein
VVEEYTHLAVFPNFHIGSGDEGTGYAADSLAVAHISGGLKFYGGSGYTQLAAFPIFQVDSGDKGTGYAADCLTVTRVSDGLEFYGGCGIHSSDCIPHLPHRQRR